jgi:hypothetical protein
MKICSLILGVILCFCTLAQEDSPVLLGSWTATAAPNQIFGGAWSAQASLHNPNRALGSWTLINEAGDVILEGMWSAQKSGQRWQGTWTARPMKGQSLSGTWTADTVNLNAESLAEMLKSTATKRVTGLWRSGRHQGNWRLKGFQTKMACVTAPRKNNVLRSMHNPPFLV